MTQLILSQQHIDLILDESVEAFPNECCGLLIGHGIETVVLTQTVPADNQATTPDRFLIDPQLQFDWIRKLRDTDQRIVGHYHSHPNGRAEPSRHDEDMALETGQIWVIVPVDAGRSGDLKAFEVCPNTGAFVPVSIKGA